MDFVSKQFEFEDNDPVVVIAEIGVNHNGSVDIALRLIDSAVEAGVDIVKFQVFEAEREISRFAELAPYQKETAPHAANQVELCKPLELSHEALHDIWHHCARRNVGFLCSAFDIGSIDFLVDELGVKSLKIASGEITNIPLLEHVARRQIGVILSTGASTLQEVDTAVSLLKRVGTPELVLLHCVSQYPAPISELNLRAIATLKESFDLPVGFSDHSQGIEASIASAALGAVVIEKHFTLDRNMEGPDHRASAEPEEMREIVVSLRVVKPSLGDGEKRPMPCEQANIALIRRGLVANGPLRRGQRLERQMLEVKRPAIGIAPRDLEKIVGRTVRCDLEHDEPVTWDNLD
jgi:N-acetylneuraminate synthase